MSITRNILAKTSAKTRSERGASLPLALMLFLICALLASIVLAATTAVSGRHANLAEMDQRYYSVVSAAQLMESEFENHPVMVECTQVKKVTTTLSDGGSGIIGRDEEEEIQSVTLTINNKELNSDRLTLSELSVKNMLPGANDDPVDYDAMWDDSTFDDIESFNNKYYTLNIDNPPEDVNPLVLQVSIKESFTDGVMTVKVSSVPFEGASEDVYSLSLKFVPDIETSESSYEVIDAAATSALVEKKTVTTTRTAKIEWSLSELHKEGVAL